ncbi:MAG: hypothetical protein WKF62_08185 [Solirubrobacterales bacterium]
MSAIAPVASRSRSELEAGLGAVRSAPGDEGTLCLIARRPAIEEREMLDEAELDLEVGMVGDVWAERPSSKTGAPNPAAQVTVMSARVAALVAGGDDHDAWAQAGDQLYVDLDLSEENLPPGARLEIGIAVLEVTADPHLGCGKFIKRFGADAMKLVSSKEGRALRLRGMNTRVVVAGRVAAGNAVRKVLPA